MEIVDDRPKEMLPGLLGVHREISKHPKTVRARGPELPSLDLHFPVPSP